jgi:hypothetical protein
LDTELYEETSEKDSWDRVPSGRPVDFGSTPGKFYKRSQEKNSFPAAGSFLAFQPTSLSKIVVAFHSAISGRYFIHAARLVFLASGFHHFGATKPVGSETHKQHGCQMPTMVLLGTRSP